MGTQVIQLSAINVVFNPHPEGIYERLLRTVFRRKIVAHIYGDRHGLMSQLHKVTERNRVIALEGVISTFSKLDPTLPWFNSATSTDASEEELNEVQVPDYLQPNHKQCPFYFDLATHTLIFNSLARKGGITARQMFGFLQQVFSSPDVSQAIGGTPRLTIIPDARSIEEVVDWNRIRSLFIDAHRPNPDYDEDDLREFEQSLVDQHAKKLEMRLVAADNQYLQPSEKVQTIAAIAAENGYVEARGEDESGHTETRSTKNVKPLVERDTYDEEVETAWDAFRRVAQETATSISARRRGRQQR